MAKLRFAQFSGEIPKLITRLLPDSAAQIARNVRLDDGGLTPVRKAAEVTTFDDLSDIQTIYKWGDTWLAWESVVNAVPGPVATDRLYYTGDGAPKMRVGSTIYDLVVPYPSAAVTATLSSFSSRQYAYTYVSNAGVESGPSPIVTFAQYNSNRRVILKELEDIPTLPTSLTTALARIVVLNGGSGYTNGETVNIAATDGSGSGATGTVAVTSGKVTAVTIVSAGSGFTDEPVTITAADGSGTGASGVGFVTVIEKQKFYRNVGGTWYFVDERDASTADWTDTYDTATINALPASSVITAPALAPTTTYETIVAPTTRLYVYTWVTQFGEESEPCPVSNEVEWEPSQTVSLTGFSAIPSGRAISKQRIYRSQSSNQSGTDLFFIAERDASTLSFTDDYAPDQFGEVLPSKDWNAPPDGLQGLIALPNGMMAAFTGKELCFCEPYRPHAWPEKYRLTASFEIVGLGAYGTTVVAGTKGYPYVASGNAPESMVEEKIEVNLPCINARGLVDLGYSVAYPSNDGLVVVSSGGATVATDALFTRADWQKLNPATLVSGQFAGRYFTSYSYTEIDGKTIYSGTNIIDLTGQQPFVIQGSFKAKAFYYDLPSGVLYYLVGATVYEYDALGQTNEIMTWKSKRVVSSQPITLGAILIDSGVLYTPEQKQSRLDEIAAVEAYNAPILEAGTEAEIDGAAIDTFSIGGDALMRLPPDKWLSVRVYADGELVRTVTDLDKVKRIKARSARVWEIEVNGTAEVEQVLLATTARELAEIG